MAHQAPLFTGFSRQEYWSGLSCPPPGIFPTQGWNLCLLHGQADSLTPCHLGDSSSGTLGVTVCNPPTLLSWMEVSDVFDRDRQEHVKETDHCDLTPSQRGTSCGRGQAAAGEDRGWQHRLSLLGWVRLTAAALLPAEAFLLYHPGGGGRGKADSETALWPDRPW